MALFRLICCFTVFALIITSFTTTASTITKPPRFVSKLIHHYTVGSAIESSAARFAYLTARVQLASLANATTTRTESDDDDFRSGIIPDNKNKAYFMANISFGDPPVPQLLAMDTGSLVLWAQCLPCANSFWKPCFPQTAPVFDPSKSSTYANKSCFAPSCLLFRSNTSPCDSSNNCHFSEKYANGLVADGVVATEKLTFETSDQGTTSVSNIVFGCAFNINNGGLNGQSSGILGLGNDDNDKVSLATQLGSKFSYCIGLMRDPQYPYNQLILGDGAKIEGPSTPVEFFAGLYFLTLDSISVGETQLAIDPAIFRKTPSGDRGVMIDSGSALTYLARPGYNVLSFQVQNLTNGLLTRMDKPGYEPPCYEGVIDRDLVGFPSVAFHFAGGVDLVLDAESMFVEAGPNQFCMAVAPSKHADLSVIGVLAQQNYNVGYDLAAKTISFQRIDCQLLET